MFTRHVCALAVLLGGGGNGGEVTNEKALKPVTTVQNSASTFLTVK